MGEFGIVSHVEAKSAKFEAIYGEYIDHVYNLCLSKLGNKEDAEDATSDTFLWILQNLERLDVENKAKFKVLMIKIAIHKSIDIARKRGRRFHAELNPEVISAGPSKPDEHFIKKTEIERIRKVMDTLPDQYRTILLLKYQQNLEAKEMEDILKVSAENLRVRLCRAHKMLVTKLKEIYE